MATDAYGINDVSLLSGPNQNTARQVQQAFTNSMLENRRQMARYSLPQLSNYAEDNALTQAQTAAGEINQNQQLHDVLDAMNHTPHGVGQNLAAYLPALGALQRLVPSLFGTDATTALGKQGLIPTAYNAVKSWFTDPNTGTQYGLDAGGNTVSMYDSSGNMIPLSQQFTSPNLYGNTTGGMLTQNMTAQSPISGFSPITNQSAMDQWPLAGGDSGLGTVGNAADFGADAGSDFGGAAGDIFGGL